MGYLSIDVLVCNRVCALFFVGFNVYHFDGASLFMFQCLILLCVCLWCAHGLPIPTKHVLIRFTIFSLSASWVVGVFVFRCFQCLMLFEFFGCSLLSS